MNVGDLFMGIIGCGYAIIATAMEGAACIGGALVDMYNTVDCSGYYNVYSDVALLILGDKVNKIALVVGIVIGANYMSLINGIHNRKKRRKKK